MRNISIYIFLGELLQMSEKYETISLCFVTSITEQLLFVCRKNWMFQMAYFFLFLLDPPTEVADPVKTKSPLTAVATTDEIFSMSGIVDAKTIKQLSTPVVIKGKMSIYQLMKERDETKKKTDGPVSCLICDRTVTQKGSLKIHVDMVHLKLRPFQCDICDKRFHTRHNLKQHVDGVHLELLPFSCKKCDKSFHNQQNLKVHVNSVHLKLKPFSCKICDKSFSQNGKLKRHVDFVHLELRTFACKKLWQKFLLRRKSPQPYQLCSSQNNTFHLSIVWQKFLNEEQTKAARGFSSSPADSFPL